MIETVCRPEREGLNKEPTKEKPMSDTREIRRMIATATIGDGDQILNILEKICDRLDEITRHDAGNCEVCAAQYEANAVGAVPTTGHRREYQ